MSSSVCPSPESTRLTRTASLSGNRAELRADWYVRAIRLIRGWRPTPYRPDRVKAPGPQGMSSFAARNEWYGEQTGEAVFKFARTEYWRGQETF
jgi:hypothetical protein